MIYEETLVFLRACVLGAALAVVYDLFRVLRMIIRWHPILVGIQDVIYFVFAAVITFSFLMAFHDGQLRVFILVGELMGGVLYFFTVSILFLKLTAFVVETIKKPFRWIKTKLISSFSSKKMNKQIQSQ